MIEVFLAIFLIFIALFLMAVAADIWDRHEQRERATRAVEKLGPMERDARRDERRRCAEIARARAREHERVGRTKLAAEAAKIAGLILEVDL